MSSDLFNLVREDPDHATLRCVGGLGLKYATLERIPKSKMFGTKAHWVLRRLDWLLPQEGRDPKNNPATTEGELRELLEVLSHLNQEIE